MSYNLPASGRTHWKIFITGVELGRFTAEQLASAIGQNHHSVANKLKDLIGSGIFVATKKRLRSNAKATRYTVAEKYRGITTQEQLTDAFWEIRGLPEFAGTDTLELIA